MSPPSVPPQAPSSGRPLPIRRVPWGGFPDLTGTIRRLRLLAPRRASLRLLRSALPPLRPLRSPRVGRFPEDLDHFYRGARAASSRWGSRDIPGSWTTLAYMPRSSTPADLRPQATTGPAMWSSTLLTASTPLPGTFEALSRALHALCVRFAAGVTPRPRNTRFRLVASLDRAGLSPAGSHQWFTVMSFRLHGVLHHQASPGATAIPANVFGRPFHSTILARFNHLSA